MASKRKEIFRKVTARSNEKAKEYGIEVLDVRVKRADLPPENEQAVYGRMRAERQRIARQYRSEGKEEALKIRSTTDKVKTILLADAYEQEQRLRGPGHLRRGLRARRGVLLVPPYTRGLQGVAQGQYDRHTATRFAVSAVPQGGPLRPGNARVGDLPLYVPVKGFFSWEGS